MLRRRFFRILLVTAAAVCVLMISGNVSAQGRSQDAFERVREVQERHTQALMARPGVVGTAIGLNNGGQLVVLVLLEKESVPDIPVELENVPVRRVVTGTITALGKPTKPPGQGRKNPPPAEPTGLRVVDISSSEVRLDWNDNTETDLDHYNVYRATVSGGTYTRVESASVADGSAYTDVSLFFVPGSTYYYVVTAVDSAAKESGYSNEAAATIPSAPGDTTPPVPPQNLAATTISTSRIDLNWDDNAEDDLSHYEVYRSPDGLDSSYAILASSVAASAYSDTGLTASTTYFYKVRAVDTAGNPSGFSTAASATTDAAPEPANPWSRFPRPVPIGVSTGHLSITAGTIGCRVKNAAGQLFALSNNHVYADENQARIGDAVIQPGTYDGGTSPTDDIGTLADFERIIWYPLGLNTIDAAIAAVDEDHLDRSTPSEGYGLPGSGIVAPELGMEVQKYGRTTRLTHGTITGVNSIILVQYSAQLTIFTGQIMIEGTGASFSAGGDSGSLVVTDDANCNPVGLLFAGSPDVTYANPIGSVLSRFGVTIDGR